MEITVETTICCSCCDLAQRMEVRLIENSFFGTCANTGGQVEVRLTAEEADRLRLAHHSYVHGRSG